jgi:hypothetical protein
MPQPILTRLQKRGEAAGKLIAEHFADAAGLPPTDAMNWKNHRWLRLRTLLRALQAYFEEYAAGFEADRIAWDALVEDPPSASYNVSKATAEQILELLKELDSVGTDLDDAGGLKDNIPKPPPDLVLRPDLSSST